MWISEVVATMVPAAQVPSVQATTSSTAESAHAILMRASSCSHFPAMKVPAGDKTKLDADQEMFMQETRPTEAMVEEYDAERWALHHLREFQVAASTTKARRDGALKKLVDQVTACLQIAEAEHREKKTELYTNFKQALEKKSNDVAQFGIDADGHASTGLAPRTGIMPPRR